MIFAAISQTSLMCSFTRSQVCIQECVCEERPQLVHSGLRGSLRFGFAQERLWSLVCFCNSLTIS